MADPIKQGYLMGSSPNQFTFTGLIADYKDIAEFIGVTAIATGVTIPAGVNKLGLRAALASGKAFHIAVSYKDGNNKRKRSKILVPIDHIGGALALTGKTFKGSTILGVVIPQHLTFG